MVVYDHNWLLITWLMCWQLLPELLEKVGTVFLVGRLGGMEVDIAWNTGAQCSNQGDGATTLIGVHHRNGLMWLLPAAKAPLSDAPEVHAHFVEVDDVSLLFDPLGQLGSKESALILDTRLIHASPGELLPLTQSDTGFLVDLLQQRLVKPVVGKLTLQQDDTLRQGQGGVRLHALPLGDLLCYLWGDGWSEDSDGSTIWWMALIVLDVALDGVVHVDEPALHSVSNFGVSSLSEAEVSQAPKPEKHHLVLLESGEVSVKLVRVTAQLLLARILQFVAPGGPHVPELLGKVLVVLAHVGVLLPVALVVAAPLPFIE